MKVDYALTTSVGDLLAPTQPSTRVAEGSFRSTLEDVQREAEPHKESQAPDRGERRESKPSEASTEVSESESRDLEATAVVAETPMEVELFETADATDMIDPEFVAGETMTSEVIATAPVVEQAEGPLLPEEVLATDSSLQVEQPIESEQVTEIVVDEEADDAVAVESLDMASEPATREPRSIVDTTATQADAVAETPIVEPRTPRVVVATEGAAQGLGESETPLTSQVPLGGHSQENSGSGGGSTPQGHDFHLIDSQQEESRPQSNPSTEPAPAASSSHTSATHVGAASAAQLSTSESQNANTQVRVDAVSDGVGNTESVTTRSAAGAEAARKEEAAMLRLDPADEVEMARRLQRVVRRAVRRGPGELRVQLDPPQMGRVDIQVRVVSDALDVRIEVDNEAVRELLSKHLGELESALGALGLTDEGVSIDLRQDRGDGGTLEQRSDSQQSEVSEDSSLTSEQQLVDTSRGGVVDLKG